MDSAEHRIVDCTGYVKERNNLIFSLGLHHPGSIGENGKINLGAMLTPPGGAEGDHTIGKILEFLNKTRLDQLFPWNPTALDPSAWTRRPRKRTRGPRITTGPPA